MGFLLTLIIFAALFLLSELLRPKPEFENAKPAGLGDFNFPTATEGRQVPLVWGTIQITGPNVVWYGNLVTSAITEKIKTGLFSSSRVTVGYRYSVGMQFALCRGPVDQLRQIWVGDDILIDATASPIVHDGTKSWSLPYFFGGDDVGGNGGTWGTLLFKSGTDTQTVSSYLGNFQTISAEAGPAYRGICYICPNASAWYVGNSASIKPWKFEIRRIPQAWGDFALGEPNFGYAPTAYLTVNSADANPVAVLYEILTDTDWGLSYDDTQIDIPKFWYALRQCHSEGNGFSMVLDQQMEVKDLIRLLLEQMDAVLYQDQETGLFTIDMIRPAADLIDPTPPAVLPIDASNLVMLSNFTRGSWENAPNQLLLEFFDRDDEYKQTYAGAQDMGSIRIQDANIRSQLAYPGVKDASLAAKLAWRELISMSYPLVKVTAKVDRSFWNAKPGQRVSLTDEDLGITTFGMRIASLNLGRLTEGVVELELVEDIFKDYDAAFADVPGSGWTDPSEAVVAFTTQIAFESPRAFNSRVFASPELTRIWAAARRVGSESAFDIMTTLATTYEKAGDCVGFLYVGELNGAITEAGNGAIPWYNAAAVLFQIDPDPDTAANMLTALDVTATDAIIGTQLLNLIMIGNELMFVTLAAEDGGNNLDVTRVYRGVLDTKQEAHSALDPVYILAAGGNIADELTFVSPDDVDVKLLPKALSGILDIASATKIDVSVVDRARLPYIVSYWKMNAVQAMLTPASLDLEAGAGTWDTDGIDFVFRRRDYRIVDETAHMLADAATVSGDFPSANTHKVKIEVIKDYSTTPVSLYTGETDLTTLTLLLVEILRYNAGAVPGELHLRLYTEHVDAGDTLTSFSEYDIQIPTISATSLTGLFNMGADAAANVSNVFTTASSGTHTLRIQTAFANAIQYRVNGGTWLTAIAAAATSGIIPATTAGDTIELRHSETATGLIQLAYLRDNTAAADAAYWVPYV